MTQWLLRIFCVLLSTSACVTLTRAARAVELEEANSQVFLQSDGSIDVTYTLEISDTERRSEIKKIGQYALVLEYHVAKRFADLTQSTNQKLCGVQAIQRGPGLVAPIKDARK